MRPSNGLAPYPILASFRDDYLDSTFSSDVECAPGPRNVSVSCRFELYDEGLRSLIDKGLACYLLHVECGVTSYRRVFKSQVPILRVSIPLDSAIGTIDVCTFVAATQDIEGYTNTAFHPDYSGLSFDVPKGGILAIADACSLQIEETNDEDVPPSLIRAARADHDEPADVQVSTDANDYIVIRLNPRTYDLYLRQGNGPLADVIFSLILLPALQTVLSRMAQGDEDADKDWYKSIQATVESYGIALQDMSPDDPDKSPMAVAQMIFDDPVARALETVSEQLEATDED